MKIQIPHSGSPLQQDALLKQKLRELRRLDNYSNFLYIGRAYAVIAITISAALWVSHFGDGVGLDLHWRVPILVLAVIIVGASQHQLAGATHEATHYILFKNRLLNELISDLLCMHPLFGSTHLFRLHHLAHHHFINDPVRDPDFSQLRSSGHWLRFPVAAGEFLTKLFQQLWLPNLLRYVWDRVLYDSLGEGENPYKNGPSRHPRLLFGGTIVYCAVLWGVLYLCRAMNQGVVFWLAPLAFLAASTLLIRMLPEKCCFQSRLRPVIPSRAAAVMRLSFLTALLTALSALSHWTGQWVGKYFLLLWVVPLLTTFPFFMLVRQFVQHGNGGRGWLNNTRVFLVNPLTRYAVFPFGMNYHLPHHMFATVPHYRLPELHRFLLQYPNYAQKGLVVQNWFLPSGRSSPRNPTALEVIGPEYSACSQEVFIDSSVLDSCRVEGRNSIRRHEIASRQS